MSPLILTLVLDAASQAFFDRLRRQHFPPERNVLDAHLTLFHALDGEQEAAILADIRAAVGPAFPIDVSGLRSLGRGVAYTIVSDQLTALRGRLARAWAPMLTAQDQQRFAPHVTIQNKASSDDARALLATLRAGFTPFPATASGLALWRYKGGPWEAVDTIVFSEERPEALPLDSITR